MTEVIRTCYFPHVSCSWKRRSSNLHTASPSKPQVTIFVPGLQFHTCGAGVADLSRKRVDAANPLQSRSARGWERASAADLAEASSPKEVSPGGSNN